MKKVTLGDEDRYAQSCKNCNTHQLETYSYFCSVNQNGEVIPNSVSMSSTHFLKEESQGGCRAMGQNSNTCPWTWSLTSWPADLESTVLLYPLLQNQLPCSFTHLRNIYYNCTSLKSEIPHDKREKESQLPNLKFKVSYGRMARN